MDLLALGQKHPLISGLVLGLLFLYGFSLMLRSLIHDYDRTFLGVKTALGFVILVLCCSIGFMADFNDHQLIKYKMLSAPAKKEPKIHWRQAI